MAHQDHSIHSSLREKLIEHVFVAGVMQQLWSAGRRDIELLRAEVDNAGYDLAIETGGVLRHIQLKASVVGSTTRKVSVQTALAAKRSGCVVWIWVNGDTLTPDHYLWFGAAPRAPLPDLGDRLTKHSKANADGVKALRSALRDLSRGRFERINGMPGLVRALFGLAPHGDMR
jgi:hypothetical protein